MAKKYLYHNFPRPDSLGVYDRACIKKGMQILKSLVKYGLLFCPEQQEYPEQLSNGTLSPPAYFTQMRICFTALSRNSLKKHCKYFGPFTLEFETQFLREIGTMPVISFQKLELPTGQLGDSLAASMLVNRLAGIYGFLRDSKYASLAPSLEALAGLIYPVDSVRYNTPELHYYLQREWRLTTNFAKCLDLDVTKATAVQKKELEAIDHAFFNRLVCKGIPNGSKKRKDVSKFLKIYKDKHILEFCSQIMVPKGCKQKTNRLLNSNGISGVTVEVNKYL